jgi:hypothetical protein
VTPIPPWVIATLARARIGACGTNLSARPFGGTRSAPGSFDGRVAMIVISEPARASNAV